MCHSCRVHSCSIHGGIAILVPSLLHFVPNDEILQIYVPFASSHSGSTNKNKLIFEAHHCKSLSVYSWEATPRFISIVILKHNILTILLLANTTSSIDKISNQDSMSTIHGLWKQAVSLFPLKGNIWIMHEVGLWTERHHVNPWTVKFLSEDLCKNLVQNSLCPWIGGQFKNNAFRKRLVKLYTITNIPRDIQQSDKSSKYSYISSQWWFFLDLLPIWDTNVTGIYSSECFALLHYQLEYLHAESLVCKAEPATAFSWDRPSDRLQ